MIAAAPVLVREKAAADPRAHTEHVEQVGRDTGDRGTYGLTVNEEVRPALRVGRRPGQRPVVLLDHLLNNWFLEQGVSTAQADADGLRWAIRITVAVNIRAAILYMLAARTLREDIAKGEQTRGAN